MFPFYVDNNLIITTKKIKRYIAKKYFEKEFKNYLKNNIIITEYIFYIK